MHIDGLIVDLALILIVASIVTLIFRKLKQPVVLGYIIAGFLISPNFEYLPTVVDKSEISVWGEIGVIFLMFGLGLEFSFKKIASVGGSAFVVACTVMIGMISVGTGLGHLLGFAPMDCIFLGGMLSMSSTMIILKSFDEYKLKRKRFAQMVLGTLVIEDVAGIFMLIILSAISVGQNVSGLEMSREMGMMLIFLVAWFLAGVYVLPSFYKLVRPWLNDELHVIVSLAICMAMVLIANAIGFSSALGAFMAGSIIAGTIQADRIERLTTPIKDLFGAIFFVSVGMLINPSILTEYIFEIIIICICVIVGQMFFATLGTLLSGQSLDIAIRSGFCMVQIGEFSFFVATLGMSLGVISDFLYPVIVCVSVITSFVTPLFIRNSERVYKSIDKRLPNRVHAFLRKNTSPTQGRRTRDPDWSAFMKTALIRTTIGTLSMFVISFIGFRFVEPFLRNAIVDTLSSDIVTAIVIVTVMLPFANYMYEDNNTYFVKLWVKSNANRLPLVTLEGMRLLIAAGFISLVIYKLLNIPIYILIALSLVLVILVVRSDFISGVNIDMEIRFAKNFSERVLAKEKRENHGMNMWMEEDLFVAQFKVLDGHATTTIVDFARSRLFVLTIIKIKRGKEIINMPCADQLVKAGDILYMMGTQEEMDSCMLHVEQEPFIERVDTPAVTMKQFMYGQTFRGIPADHQLVMVPVIVDAKSEFQRKSIKNSNIRSKYGGTVIGIDRGNLSIVRPDLYTIIRKDDILWVIGDVKKVVNITENTEISTL